MVNANSVDIPVPMGSGATDQPDVQQHGVPAVNKFAGVKLDMSKSEPISASTNKFAGVKLDMSKSKPLPAATPPAVAPAAPKPQPGVWGTITQPTEKTDKEYLGYTGPAGVAGATVHGLNKVAEDTGGFFKGMYHMAVDPATEEEKKQDIAVGAGDDTGVLGRIGLVRDRALKSMYEPALNAVKTAPQIPGAIRDINASPEAEQRYEQAAEDTASTGAGMALGSIAMEGAPKAVEAPIRGAAKAYNLVTQQAPGAAGYLVAGRPGYYAAKGMAHMLPEAPESLTEYGRSEKQINYSKRSADSAKAADAAAKAKAEADSYAASEADRPGSTPQSVVSKAERTAKAAADAQYHADIAKEAWDKERTPKGKAMTESTKTPKEVPAAQIQAKPAAPPPVAAPVVPPPAEALGRLGTPKPAMRPMNVKGPGEVQPETFPQTPTERPVVPQGQVPLANAQGRMGGTKMLPEMPQRLPEGEVLPAEQKAPAPVAPPKEPTTIEANAKQTKAAATKPIENRVAEDRRQETAQVEEERRVGPRRNAAGIRVDEQGNPVMSPDVQTHWQSGVFGEKPAEDIGAKARAANPEPTRAETKGTPTTEGLGKLGVEPKRPTMNTEAPPVEAAPKVSPKKLENQIREGLGGTEQKPNEPIANKPEPKAEPEVSSDKRRNVLRQAGATPEQEKAILMPGKQTGQTGLTRVEMSQLAEHFGVKTETAVGADAAGAIGRAKGDLAAGTHIPPHELLQKIIDAGHSPADIVKAIDEGKHLPGSVAGGAPDTIGTAEGAKATADQIAAHNENGGSTFHPTKGNLNGTDHFSVGGDPSFRKPELTMITDGKNLTAAQLDEYKSRPAVKEALAKDKDASVGSWHDADTGKTVTELVKTPTDREAAIKMGKDNNQKAIYDLKTGTEIPTGGTGETVEKGTAYAGEERRASEKPYTGEERRTAPPNATETEAKMKAGEQFKNPVDETAGAKETIKKDLEAKGLGTPKAERFASPEKGVPESSLGKGADALKAQDATAKWDKVAESWKAPEGPKAEAKGTPKATMDTARMSDAELLKEGFTKEDIANGKHLPGVGGGSGATGTAAAKEGAFDALSEEHLTDEEKAGLSKSGIMRRNYADNMAKMPPLQQWIDYAKGGEGARNWYARSRTAFQALREEAPRYFQPEDGQRWANFVASLSPRQMVHKNLAEAIHAWTQWVDDGRPMDDAGMEKSLRNSIMSTPNTKVPNAMKGLQGKEMWPDLTKNSNFKVPSFGMNLSPAENLAQLKKFTNAVTNDGWEALTAGVDEKTISSPSSYHPLSVMTRAAAKELGWTAEEAQSAIWSFTQAVKERGEADPQYVREYSEDFADILANNDQIRNQLKEAGVDLGKLDAKLKAIGEKPQVTSGASPTTEHSVRELKERIETARGKGSVPEPKHQRTFNFREAPAGEGRNKLPNEETGDTSFDPNKFHTTNEPVMGKLGKKKSAMKQMA